MSMKLIPSGIAPMHVVVELTLNVSQQAAGPNSEETWLCPLIPQLLLHQCKPRQSVLGRADPSSWFEPCLVPCALVVLTYRTHHHQGHREAAM